MPCGREEAACATAGALQHASCAATRRALVDVGSSLRCSSLSHGHSDTARVAARWTPSGLDLSRPPATTHSRWASEAGATGSASRSLAARAPAGPLPPFSWEGVPPAGGRRRLLSEKGVAVAASSTSSVEASRPTFLRRPALQQPAPSTRALSGGLLLLAAAARGASCLRPGGRQAGRTCPFAHPGHAFLKRSALCLQNRAASAAARLPTPAVVSLASPLARGPTCRLQELSNAATSSQQSAQLGAEHCGDGPRGGGSAAVLGVLVAMLPPSLAAPARVRGPQRAPAGAVQRSGRGGPLAMPAPP
jgi:hypothetical protein